MRENSPLQPAHIEGYLKMRMFYVSESEIAHEVPDIPNRDTYDDIPSSAY